MKNQVAMALLAALLGACANSPPQSAPPQWGYQPGQQAPSVISEAEAETLTAQVAEIKAHRKQARDSLFSVTDPAARAQRQQLIDKLTVQLQPLEYRLRAAGRPVPPG